MTVVRPPHPKFREVLFTESRQIVNEISVLRLRNRDLQQPWSHQLPRYLSKLRSASMQKTPLGPKYQSSNRNSACTVLAETTAVPRRCSPWNVVA